MKTKSLSLPVTLSIKWRNIAFDKSGKSYRGSGTYDTQDEALAVIEELERIIEAGNNMLVSVDGSFFPEEYDYAIALPC